MPSERPAMRKAKNDRTADRKAQIRCAIYTRKSSEEGLEQDFNSLDAQRESCEAFVRSQKHEGWVCLSEMYDDGGISGATMERPALKRLLVDIEAGRVDAVVVYKVDRLTRSLSDFAKIVAVFDRPAVSFVSVTQQFHTTTWMGRLTLNMLLSFAQCEREVTGERIRDKIAASKKKGMWRGGLPPLGYDVMDRKLVVNEREAATFGISTGAMLCSGRSSPSRRNLTATGSSARREATSSVARREASHWPEARSISCYRTASTAAKSFTRTTATPASMSRSSMKPSGTRYSAGSRRTGSSVSPVRTLTRSASSQG